MAFEELEKPILGTPKMKPGERVRYVPNRRSFGAFMRSDQMRDVTAEVATAIAARATASQPGPSEDDPERSGATYSVKRNSGVAKVAGNFRVKVEIDGTGPGVERAEFGGQDGNRYRTLASAGAAFGDFRHSEAIQ